MKSPVTFGITTLLVSVGIASALARPAACTLTYFNPLPILYFPSDFTSPVNS